MLNQEQTRLFFWISQRLMNTAPRGSRRYDEPHDSFSFHSLSAVAFVLSKTRQPSFPPVQTRSVSTLQRLPIPSWSRESRSALARKRGENRAHWQVFTHGGRRATGRDLLEWAREAESNGAGEILLTSMDRDGTASGFDCELTRTVSDAVLIPVIASGGAGSAEDFMAVFREGHADEGNRLAASG